MMDPVLLYLKAIAYFSQLHYLKAFVINGRHISFVSCAAICNMLYTLIAVIW
jgi:hypothetical protein